jgi:hypothetical protein
LTNIVKGAAVQLDTNKTHAIEKRTAIPICYGSAEGAWDAAVNYSSTPSNYPGKTFDNVGWVRGTKSVGTNRETRSTEKFLTLPFHVNDRIKKMK